LSYDGRSETVRCEFCGSTIIVPETMRSGLSQAGYMAGESPDKANNIHQVLELVRQGQKIEAIKLYRETFGVGLKEAKDIVDHLEMGQPTAITITTTSVGRQSNACGCIVGIVILLVTLAIVAASVIPIFTVGGLTQLVENPEEFVQQITEGDIEGIVQDVEQGVASLNRGMTGSPIPTTAGGDGLGADLLLENYQYGGSTVPIMLSYTEASAGDRTVRWETQVADTSGTQEYNVGFDNQHVYVSEGTAVRALSRSDGSQVWQANLSDIIDRRCLGCLRSQDGVVVALTADNTLYGLDANTGQQLWQARLTSDTARYLDEGFVGYAFLNDNVILLDESEQAGSFGFALKQFNVQTGALVNEFVPTCADVDNFFDPAPLGYYSQVFVDEAQDKLFLLYGENINGAYCLEQWEATTATPIWQTRLPGEASVSSSIGGGLITEWSHSPAFAFDGETLLIPTYEIEAPQGMALADLVNGQIKFYLPEADNELWPIGVMGDTAVIWAEKQRGTSQVSIWGLDAATGNRKWEHPLEAEYLFELDPFDDKWTYNLTPNALYILQLFATPEPAELLVQSLNIADGSLNYEVKNNLPDDYWQGVARTADRMYLTLRSLVGVDLGTGETAVEFP
jgi:outer membrane protein assembly factor BamB